MLDLRGRGGEGRRGEERGGEGRRGTQGLTDRGSGNETNSLHTASQVKLH